MRKFVFIFSMLLVASISYASINEIPLKATKTKGDRTETPTEPKASYDDESNTVEVAIEADRYFEMKVIDISGTVVFTCPVLMVDGTPTNYQLPELPAGIYTLKVESPEVTYEGIFDVK